MLAEAEQTTAVSGDSPGAVAERALSVAAGAAAVTPCERALEAFHAAERQRDAVESGGGSDEEIEAADDAVTDAHYDWLDARASTPAQIVAKGLHTIDQQHGRGNSPDANSSNPAFLAHVKQKGLDEYTIISMVQDVAALAGAPLNLPELEPFDPATWLIETAAGTHARFHYDSGAALGERFSWDGPGAEEASARFAALPSWNRSAVGHHLWSQQQAIHRAYEQPLWQTANASPCMTRLYAEMAARQIEPDDVMRRKAIRSELRATVRRLADLPVGLPDFDPAAFLLEVSRAGARLRVQFETFGPEILHRPSKSDDPAVLAVIERFCQLDADQIDQLTEAVIERRRWAAEWVQKLQDETGCTVSFHDTGIGFGIGTDHTGRLEAAAAAYNAASETDIAALRAYGQDREEEQREAARAAR